MATVKKDYTVILKKKIDTHEHECVVKHLPFCRKCVYDAVEARKAGIINEIMQTEGYSLEGEDLFSNAELVKYVEDLDFGEFTGEKKFSMVTSKPNFKVEPYSKVVTSEVESITVDYKCKKYPKHLNSVVMSQSHYEGLKKASLK